MAKVTKQLIAEEEPELEEIEEYKEYNMWVTINNNSTGNIEVAIRQYGKPKDPPPHPN